MIYFLLFFCTAVYAQDKIYLLNGVCKTGKVVEISSEELIYTENGLRQSINKPEVFMVLYSNGKSELFNAPNKDIIYNTDEASEKKPQAVKPVFFQQHFVSINTLALCNADIALFYEHLHHNKKFGYGLMGAYNFNLYVISPNYFLILLQNAKKMYDLGAFINFYPKKLSKKNNFFYGLMVKYCFFKFTSVYTDPVSSNVTFSPAEGSQLATMINLGYHTTLSKNFFIKSMVALGGFNLKGVYKQQFNYMLNQYNGGSTPFEYSFLPKMYVGLNAGYNF